MPVTNEQLLANAVNLMGQQRIADALGVNEETLAMWLSGEQTMPSRKLLALAQAAVDFAKRAR